MYEIYGWVQLSPINVDDTCDLDLQTRITHVKQLCEDAQWGRNRIEVLELNGFSTLVVCANPNRKRFEAESLQVILHTVVTELPHAYGVVYEYVEQDGDGFGAGSYRVNVIRRGTIEVRQDPFLSPKIPIVEDQV